jgi:hypothetical protein
MSPYPITNAHTPLKGIDGSLVNMDSSGVGGIPFTNTRIPDGPHTLAPAGSNVQGAAGIYPCAQKGGKINRRKINKISRKYKMSGSRRTVRRHVRRMKSRVRSRYSRRSAARSQRRHKSVRRGRGRGISKGMLGGAFQPPMTAPNYAPGYNQYQNNNGSLSNTYSTGGQLAPSLSALANPVPYQNVAGDVDNLNHNTLNSYGNIGAGSGFASRGWF